MLSIPIVPETGENGKEYSMAKRKQDTHCVNWNITAKGIAFVLPKTDDLSPTYSRKELKRIIAGLQEALDDDLGATLLR
jgi:hypothetical protein